MNSKETKLIIQRLSQKYRLPEYRIEEIIRSQFEFLSNEMKFKEDFGFSNIQILGLGKFYTNRPKIYIVKKLKAIKKQKENDLS